MIRIKDITNYLEQIAPLDLQEGYDNAGLIVGDPNQEISQALICLDSTEEVVDEAIATGCELIIAHHPIVFGGLKRFNGRDYVERVVMKAIKNDIAIYAAHTNLDNVLRNGVNGEICDRLGIINRRILAPKSGGLRKVVVFCPIKDAEAVRTAMFDAGAGAIGAYDHCSFNLTGKGTYRPLDGANPHLGKVGEEHTEEEIQVSVICSSSIERAVVSAMRQAHPYEEVAYEVYALQNKNPEVGSGMIGELSEPMGEEAFLQFLKTTMKAEGIRYTNLLNKPVKTVAVCGGAGSFFIGRSHGAKSRCFYHRRLQIPSVF